MIVKPAYFNIQELVCEHVYDYYGETAWQFFDSRLLLTLDSIRERIGKAIFVNNWMEHGANSQRGLRCFRCDLVKAKIEVNEMYMSAHCLGKATDFDVEGLLAEEVRNWIVAKASWWPYPIRLEKNVSWCHLDVYDSFDPERSKVYLFDA